MIFFGGGGLELTSALILLYFSNLLSKKVEIKSKTDTKQKSKKQKSDLLIN
jgi:hypothetical protein